MAAKSIFGSCVSLPSIPGLYSTCEEELLDLMKEVDLIVEKKQEESEKEIKEVQLLCQSQKDEIEHISDALKQKHDECYVLRQQLQTECRKYLSQEEHLLKQITELKEENSALKRKNKVLQNEVKEVDIDELHLKTSGELINKLQDEIVDLKDQVWRKDQQLNCLEASYQKLLIMITSLQEDLKNKENDKKNKIPKYLDLYRVDERTTGTIEKFAKDEEEHVKKLQFKISQEMDLLKENLKKSLDF